MADVRCPMCGKPNPEELEVCQFCQARLKPLVIKPTSPDQPPSSQEGSADWLQDLRGKESVPGEAEGGGETPEEGGQPESGEASEWLDRIRERKENDGVPPTLASWVEEGIQDEDGKSEQSLSWLDSIRGKSEEGEGTPSEASEESEGEGADWLERIHARQEEETQPGDETAGQTPVHEGGETPDWLEGLSSDSGDAVEEPARPDQGGMLPDWLNDTAELSGGEVPENQAEEPAFSPEGLPDWIAGLQDEAAEGAAAAGAEEPAREVSEGEAEEPALPAEELPDWIAGLQTSEAGEGTPAAGAEEPAGEIPEWMTEIQPGEGEPAAPSDESALDWPAGPAESEEGAAKTPPESAQEGAETGAETPDWLAELGEPAGETTGETEASSEIGAETPDWLAELGEPAGETTGETEATSEIDWEAATGSLEGIPAQDEGLLEEGAAEPTGEDEVPDWLKNIRTRKAEESGAGEPAPFMEGEAPAEEEAEPNLAGTELPDWLAQIKPEEGGAAPAEATPAAEEGESGLAPAELPGWVQAMRPIETAAPRPPSEAEGEQPVEKAGPLAGLQGILPAEPVGEISKPPVFSIKLQVNDRQRVQATLLESLLGAEAEPQTPPAEHAVSAPQRVLRWVIAVLMLAAVFYPVVTGSQIVPLPQLFPVETVAENDLINALPAGAPVLVAVDYQPALAGEMQASSTAVLESLMERGARLAFISTTPNGPALAQSLLDGVLARNSALQSLYGLGSQNVVNMGYLAGGAAGLADFAVRPQETQVYALDMSMAWDHPALKGVTSLAGFAQVLVITDSADNGRAWVEQVQPVLGSTPMTMVISAQSAPLMLPYYESGQVKGMVSGMAGGAAFEQIAQRPATARQYWDPFQAGILVATVLIIVGAIVNAGMMLIAERKADHGVSS
jgi:hypothetical protein